MKSTESAGIEISKSKSNHRRRSRSTSSRSSQYDGGCKRKGLHKSRKLEIFYDAPEKLDKSIEGLFGSTSTKYRECKCSDCKQKRNMSIVGDAIPKDNCDYGCTESPVRDKDTEENVENRENIKENVTRIDGTIITNEDKLKKKSDSLVKRGISQEPPKNEQEFLVNYVTLPPGCGCSEGEYKCFCDTCKCIECPSKKSKFTEGTTSTTSISNSTNKCKQCLCTFPTDTNLSAKSSTVCSCHKFSPSNVSSKTKVVEDPSAICHCEPCKCNPCVDPNKQKQSGSDKAKGDKPKDLCKCGKCDCTLCLGDKKSQKGSGDPCTCSICKCKPCQDPSKAGGGSQKAGDPCLCPECKCKPCSDPRKSAGTKTCKCGNCTCKECPDASKALSQKAGDPCMCPECKCKPCSDPSKSAGTKTCKCGNCTCKDCPDASKALSQKSGNCSCPQCKCKPCSGTLKAGATPAATGGGDKSCHCIMGCVCVDCKFKSESKTKMGTTSCHPSNISMKSAKQTSSATPVKAATAPKKSQDNKCGCIMGCVCINCKFNPNLTDFIPVTAPAAAIRVSPAGDSKGCKCAVCYCTECTVGGGKSGVKETKSVPTLSSTKLVAPCMCPECKCNPCSDPAKSQAKWGDPCACLVCKCKPCSDPTKSSAKGDKLGVCKCGNCKCLDCKFKKDDGLKSCDCKNCTCPVCTRKGSQKGDGLGCNCKTCTCPVCTKKGDKGSEAGKTGGCSCKNCTCPVCTKKGGGAASQTSISRGAGKTCDCKTCTCPVCTKKGDKGSEAGKTGGCNCKNCTCPVCTKKGGAAASQTSISRGAGKTCDCKTCTCPVCTKKGDKGSEAGKTGGCNCKNCTCPVCTKKGGAAASQTNISGGAGKTCDCKTCTCPVCTKKGDKGSEAGKTGGCNCKNCTCPVCTKKGGAAASQTNISGGAGKTCDCKTCTCPVCTKKGDKGSEAGKTGGCNCKNCTCPVCTKKGGAAASQTNISGGAGKTCDCKTCTCPVCTKKGDKGSEAGKTGGCNCKNCTCPVCTKKGGAAASQTNISGGAGKTCDCKTCTCPVCTKKGDKGSEAGKTGGCNCKNCTCPVCTKKGDGGKKSGGCNCTNCTCPVCTKKGGGAASQTNISGGAGKTCDCKTCTCPVCTKKGDKGSGAGKTGGCNCKNCTCPVCTRKGGAAASQTNISGGAGKTCDCKTCTCPVCTKKGDKGSEAGKTGGCNCKNCTCPVCTKKGGGAASQTNISGGAGKTCDCKTCTCPVCTKKGDKGSEAGKTGGCNCKNCTCPVCTKKGGGAASQTNISGGAGKTCDCKTCTCPVCTKKGDKESEAGKTGGCNCKNCTCPVCTKKGGGAASQTNISGGAGKTCDCKTCTCPVCTKKGGSGGTRATLGCTCKTCTCPVCTKKGTAADKGKVTCKCPSKTGMGEGAKKMCDCKTCSCPVCTRKPAGSSASKPASSSDQGKGTCDCKTCTCPVCTRKPGGADKPGGATPCKCPSQTGLGDGTKKMCDCKTCNCSVCTRKPAGASKPTSPSRPPCKCPKKSKPTEGATLTCNCTTCTCPVCTKKPGSAGGGEAPTKPKKICKCPKKGGAGSTLMCDCKTCTCPVCTKKPGGTTSIGIGTSMSRLGGESVKLRSGTSGAALTCKCGNCTCTDCFAKKADKAMSSGDLKCECKPCKCVECSRGGKGGEKDGGLECNCKTCTCPVCTRKKPGQSSQGCKCTKCTCVDCFAKKGEVVGDSADCKCNNCKCKDCPKKPKKDTEECLCHNKSTKVYICTLCTCSDKPLSLTNCALNSSRDVTFDSQYLTARSCLKEATGDDSNDTTDSSPCLNCSTLECTCKTKHKTDPTGKSENPECLLKCTACCSSIHIPNECGTGDKSSCNPLVLRAEQESTKIDLWDVLDGKEKLEDAEEAAKVKETELKASVDKNKSKLKKIHKERSRERPSTGDHKHKHRKHRRQSKFDEYVDLSKIPPFEVPMKVTCNPENCNCIICTSKESDLEKPAQHSILKTRIEHSQWQKIYTSKASDTIKDKPKHKAEDSPKDSCEKSPKPTENSLKTDSKDLNKEPPRKLSKDSFKDDTNEQSKSHEKIRSTSRTRDPKESVREKSAKKNILKKQIYCEELSNSQKLQEKSEDNSSEKPLVKKAPEFNQTMSNLMLAFDCLEKKGKAKDQLIEALSEALRTISGDSTCDTLMNRASVGTAPDYDRAEDLRLLENCNNYQKGRAISAPPLNRLRKSLRTSSPTMNKHIIRSSDDSILKEQQIKQISYEPSNKDLGESRSSDHFPRSAKDKLAYFLISYRPNVLPGTFTETKIEKLNNTIGDYNISKKAENGSRNSLTSSNRGNLNYQTKSSIQLAIKNLKERCNAKDTLIKAAALELKKSISNTMLTKILNMIPGAVDPAKLTAKRKSRDTDPKIKELKEKSTLRERKRQPGVVPCKCGKLHKDNNHVNLSGFEISSITRITVDSLIVKWTLPRSKAVCGYDILINGHNKLKVMSGTRTCTMIHSIDLSNSIFIAVYAVTGCGRCEPPATAIFELQSKCK